MKKTMGQRLVELREGMDLTQVDVAVATGIGRPYLSILERDKKQGSLASIAALADFYQVSMDYLYRGVPSPDASSNVLNSPEEAAWVGLWRDMNDSQRRMALAMIQAAIASSAA